MSISTILSIIAGGFCILFFLGIFLGAILPEKPGTWDYLMGGEPQTFTLWMVGIGGLGFLLSSLLLYIIGVLDIPETKYKRLEIEVPEAIRVDARFYQDSQEIHRESL